MAQTLIATATDAPRTRARRRWQPAAYLYVAPSVLVLAAFIVVPLLQTFQYSFYDWNGIGASTWAGLKNYAAVFTDVHLRDAFLHVSVLLLFYAAIPVILGLLPVSVLGAFLAYAGLRHAWLVADLRGAPLAIAVLMAVHFWRVRKDGGISGPL